MCCCNNKQKITKNQTRYDNTNNIYKYIIYIKKNIYHRIAREWQLTKTIYIFNYLINNIIIIWNDEEDNDSSTAHCHIDYLITYHCDNYIELADVNLSTYYIHFRRLYYNYHIIFQSISHCKAFIIDVYFLLCLDKLFKYKMYH